MREIFFEIFLTSGQTEFRKENYSSTKPNQSQSQSKIKTYVMCIYRNVIRHSTYRLKKEEKKKTKENRQHIPGLPQLLAGFTRYVPKAFRLS